MTTKNSKLKIKCYFNYVTVNVNCQKSKTTPTQGMKVYGGVRVQLHTFFTSAINEGKWSASCPGRFVPGTHFIRLGGPQSQSRRFGEEVSPTPIGIRTSDRPARSLLPHRLRYAGSPKPCQSNHYVSSLFICGLHRHAVRTQ
jgi:hypothetical protein